MPLTNKITNRFKCDLPECEQGFEYNPQPQPPETWPPRIQIALTGIVAITHCMSQHVKFFCCKEHAIKGFEQDLHLPPMPPKIVAASTDAEVKAAAAGAKAVTEMKKPAVRPS